MFDIGQVAAKKMSRDSVELINQDVNETDKKIQKKKKKNSEKRAIARAEENTCDF